MRLDFFPLDVDYFNDRKFKRIRAEYGFKGEGIVLRLLNEVYKNGYFLAFNDNLALDIADDTGIKPTLITEVIHAMVRCGFFDEKLFKAEHILTSAGIQKRWLVACERRKKPELVYWLLEMPEKTDETISDDNNPIYGYGNSEKDHGNYTKEKKRNEKIRIDSVITAFAEKPDRESIQITEAQELYRDYYGNRDMRKVKKLCHKYGAEAVCDAIDAAGDRATMNPYKYIEQMLFVSEECVRA